jgi:PAS domain S-box-containing protein
MVVQKTKSRKSDNRPMARKPPLSDGEAQRTIQKLTALSSIAAALSHARELDPLLNDILDTITRLFETNLAYIMLFDPAVEALRVYAVHGAPPEFIAGIDRIKPNEGIAGYVYATGKPLVLRDAATDPRITRQAVRDLGVHAAACVPLTASGTCIGVLVTATRDPDYQLPDDIELLHTIGDQLGMAIENARLFDENLRVRRLWESTFNAISDGISVHTRDMRIAKINRALTRILDVTPEDLIGSRCCPMMMNRDQPLPDCADLRAMGEAPCQATEIIERPDGQILRITVDPLLDEQGRAYGSVHVVSDISEQVALERRIARAEQLALIGELAAGLAHEVKNPLAGIKGAIEIVREGLPDDHPNRPILGHVLEEILRIDRTIGDLLEYARPRPSSRTKTDLNALIERVIATARLQAPNEHVRLEFRPAKDLPLVIVDPDEMQKVVLNLLINAIHAVKDQGRIVTETAFNSTGSDGSVVLSVTDTGIGILPENLDKIFRPFFTSKKRGTGLGLATCKRIVTSYGGTIHVESKLGQGSRFTVILPLHPKEFDLTPRILTGPPPS